jgi:hypothetical protein
MHYPVKFGVVQLGIFIFFEALEKKKIEVLFWVAKKYSLASFGSSVGFCGLQECIFYGRIY